MYISDHSEKYLCDECMAIYIYIEYRRKLRTSTRYSIKKLFISLTVKRELKSKNACVYQQARTIYVFEHRFMKGDTDRMRTHKYK